MRRPAFDTASKDEDIVVSERTYAAMNEDPDIAPSCETAVPDAKQVTGCVYIHQSKGTRQMHGKGSGTDNAPSSETAVPDAQQVTAPKSVLCSPPIPSPILRTYPPLCTTYDIWDMRG